MKDFFIISNGIKINVLTNPLKNPISILIHLHGLHSHFQFIYDCPDDLKYRISYFEKVGILSYALEFAGHGKSDGLKGYISNFNDLIENVAELVELIKHDHPNIPIFILAESMGGAVAIKYSILNKFIKGVILLAPMCGISEKVKPNFVLSKVLIGLSKVIPTWKMLSTNKLKESTPIEFEEAKQLCKYQYNGKLRMATARECYNVCKWINENCTKFDTPVLILHAKDDIITTINCSINFIGKCSSPDKELVSLDSKNHALLVPYTQDDNTPNIVMEKIIEWILARL